MKDLMRHTRWLQKVAFQMDPKDDIDIEWARHMVLGIVREAMEVLDEIPDWKEWRSTDVEYSRERYVEELIDVIHFAAALAAMTGITDEEWEQEYMRKSIVIIDRQRGSE